MKKSLLWKHLFASFVLSFLFFSQNISAQCRLLNEPFNTPVVTSPVNVDGAWYPDRYPPSAFVMDNLNGENVLRIHIDGPGDGLNARPPSFQSTFYNTQGRKFNQCGSCVTVAKADLWVPATWGNALRRSDMWATAFDATNNVTIFPIIGFRNPDGDNPGIYYWDENVGWINSGVAINYDSWYNLSFRLAGANLEYLVNGSVVGTITASGSTYFGNIMLQAYNFNDPTLPVANQSADSYDAYWDNAVTTGTGGKVVTNLNTGETFCSIQSAIDAPLTVAGNVVLAGPGLYNEDVNLSKAITLRGTSPAQSTISGPIGGPGSTVVVTASGATIEGFTITRDGNNTTDWNNPALNTGGVSIQGQAITGVTIQKNVITGNRSGIDINNSNGHSILDNVITFNRTGLIFRNQTDNLTVMENHITDNWTVGIVFLDGSGGSNVPVQSAANSAFNNNNISGNWYGEIVDRQTGGSLPAPGANQKNFTCNWFGNAPPVVTTANSMEPGYAGQIPVAYGGMAVPPPGAQPDIAGPASANFVYIPYLTNGTDNSPAIGFQPVPGSCNGPTPILTATLNSVTLTANNDGMDENGAVTVCNTAADNLFFSGISDLNNSMPAAQVKVRQELVGVNATVCCPDGDFPLSAYAGAFSRNVSLVNPSMSGTLTIRFRAYFDANNNNMIDGGDIVGDWLVYTITVNPQPRLNTSINSTVVNSNNDGMDDNAAFSVCNTSNNILFNYFVDANGVTGPNVKAYQVIQTASNVTYPFCTNCSAALTAFAGAAGTVALSNPALPGTLVIKFREFIDGNNNGQIDAGECAGDWVVYTITVKPLPACSITGPNGPVCPNSVNTYSAPAGMTTYAWTITGNGSISGASNAQTVVVNAGANCNSPFTLTLTITGNGCSSTCQKTVNVLDNTPPTFTAPANQTIMSSSTCGYTLPVANPLLITNEADNCGGAITITSSDAVAQCGNNTVVTRTWKATDACGNSTTHDQTFTVTDNNTPYIIYATSEAKFGEDNLINGDVGVTAANGKAEFKKGDVLDPYHVYAKNITVQMPAMVNNKHFVPATGGPNPPFQMYVAVPLTGNYNQTTNGTVPAGNYKELTIKKGVTATVNGSNYGKINIEENANVTFTSNSINMEELNVKKGKDPGTTNVYFTTCTAVRVKDRVTIEENSRVNVGGPKVTFYLGDSKKDEENFSVKGDNSQVTLNIMIPNGKLKVSGGNSNAIMTGWFIIEKLESDGKNVTWNKYGCGPLAKGPAITQVETKNVPAEELVDAFKVNVYPNPSSSDFRIQVLSPTSEAVTVRIFDISGKTLQVISNAAKNSFITVGGQLRSGAYYAEVQQGASRQTVKLVKVD